MSDRSINCPRCGKSIQECIVHSSGIVVTGHHALQALRELQAEVECGRSATRNAGWSDAIIPMYPPGEQKYARCHYCHECQLVVVAKSDILNDDEVPPIAR